MAKRRRSSPGNRAAREKKRDSLVLPLVLAAAALGVVVVGLLMQLTAPAPVVAQAPAGPTISIRGESPSVWTRAYTVQVTDAGRPVTGAAVTLDADHTDMPSAHPQSITLTPTGKPGEYQGEMGPVMMGTWQGVVKVSGPVKAQHGFTDTFGL